MISLNNIQDEPITEENFEKYIDYVLKSDNKILSKCSWKLIPYDYDSKNKDMAYYEIFVEGRKFEAYTRDTYENKWTLCSKKDGKLYMKRLSDENSTEYRHDVSDIIRDEVYMFINLHTKCKYGGEKFGNMSAWEYFEFNQKYELIKHHLDKMGYDLENFFKKSKHEKLDFLSEKITDEHIRSNLIEFNEIIENKAANEY